MGMAAHGGTPWQQRARRTPRPCRRLPDISWWVCVWWCVRDAGHDPLNGTFRQLAIRGGVTHSLSPYYVVDFELEWGKAPGTLSGDGLHLQVEPHGLFGGLLLLWRLDPYPTPLE